MIIKTPNVITRIVGPVGVFHIIDVCKPVTNEKTPIIEDVIAICIGVEDKFLEADAGMIRRPVINNMPTIFIEIAITLAINKVNIAVARSGFNPSAFANSKLTVPANNGLQIKINIVKTTPPPIQTNKTSVKLTDKMSPKSKPIRSILINESIPKRAPTSKGKFLFK